MMRHRDRDTSGLSAKMPTVRETVNALGEWREGRRIREVKHKVKE